MVNYNSNDIHTLSFPVILFHALISHSSLTFCADIHTLSSTHCQYMCQKKTTKNKTNQKQIRGTCVFIHRPSTPIQTKENKEFYMEKKQEKVIYLALYCESGWRYITYLLLVGFLIK